MSILNEEARKRHDKAGARLGAMMRVLSPEPPPRSVGVFVRLPGEQTVMLIGESFDVPPGKNLVVDATDPDSPKIRLEDAP